MRSYVTVSKVLHNHADISAETRERVLRRMKEVCPRMLFDWQNEPDWIDRLASADWPICLLATTQRNGFLRRKNVFDLSIFEQEMISRWVATEVYSLN